MAEIYLTLTMEQSGLDKLELFIKHYNIEVEVRQTGYFSLNTKMRYEDWKLTGDQSEIDKFIDRMNNDNETLCTRIS